MWFLYNYSILRWFLGGKNPLNFKVLCKLPKSSGDFCEIYRTPALSPSFAFCSLLIPLFQPTKRHGPPLMAEVQTLSSSLNSNPQQRSQLHLPPKPTSRNPRPQRRRRGPSPAGGGHGVRVWVRGGVGREDDPGWLLPCLR